jgi:glycosyltransferase involved in cell wall biosynthesis
MNYSLIIPFFNEAESLKNLLYKIETHLLKIKDKKRQFEIILIDDGSKDKTFTNLKKFSSKKIDTLILKHKKNYSQSSAILTGILHSKYKNIITLDGDGQNDPSDIHKLIKKYEKGVDMVIGWRKKRNDNYLTKILPSLIANFFVRFFTSSKIHDHGCALKIFKKDKLDDLTNWGDFHRLLAARFSYNNYIVNEVEVKHCKRIFGVSNYGFTRIINVILDLVYLKFFKNYKTQSIYFFGFFSLIVFLLGISSLSYMTYLKFAKNVSFILTPLPVLTIFLFTISFMILLIGFLTQLIINQSSSKENAYQNVIKKIRN